MRLEDRAMAVADWIEGLWAAGNVKATAIVELAGTIEALEPIDGTAELREALGEQIRDLTYELNAELGEWRLKPR